MVLPIRHFAILIDFETPLELSKFAGLAEGDPQVIDSVQTHANDDTIQPLVTSHKQLGTRDLFVVRQTDSREEAAVDAVMHAFLAESLNVEQNDAPAFAKGEEADWLTLSDPAAAVAADVLRIRSHPDMPDDVRVHGYLYDRNGERLIRLDI